MTISPYTDSMAFFCLYINNNVCLIKLHNHNCFENVRIEHSKMPAD